MTPLRIPPRFNLSRYCLERGARATPDKTALIVVRDVDGEPERWSYAELDRTVRAVAGGLLKRGLRQGDRILLRLPNNSNYALMFFGAIAAGLVPVPLSSQLTEAEAAFLLADSEAAAVAMSEELAIPIDGEKTIVFNPSAIEELKRNVPLAGYADTAAEDPAYMIYTSGTTSRPKGVVHAQRVALGREPMRREWQAIGADDVMLHAGAFNWSYTLGVGLLDPWAVGATAVLYTGPKDVSVWPRLIRLTGATIFAAVPSLYRQILKYCTLTADDLSSLRHGLAAGEALSPALLAEWRPATGKPLYEALGMSECSTFLSCGPDVPVRPGSAGRPQAARRIAVLPIEGGDGPLPAGEIGLLAIHRSDPGLMLGYWNRPDEDKRTTRGEWFVGGDLAAFDADGYLWYHGRADDVMNAGGYRVSPLEVEASLADCPGIAEVAVKEHRVREDVSIIAAYVVARDRAAIDADTVLAHASRKLAAYKRPKQVFFVDSLPRSANGKLLRRQL
jgi:acyl-coenzyme A synthetase/AMP-(fatty) acid ligase